MESTNTNKEEIEARTILVRKYKDKNITNSMKIRKYIKEKFPGKGPHIELAKTTAAGSILIEFDDKEIAEEIKANWNKDYLGENAGAFKASERSPVGIVKHVYLDNTTDEIKEEIELEYPDAECEFLKKDDEFMGIIKVKFRTSEDFNNALNNGISKVYLIKSTK